VVSCIYYQCTVLVSPSKSSIFSYRVPTLPGNLRARSWNFLGSDVDGSFWLQVDTFLQTKITIIVATRYVFWVACMPKIILQMGFHPGLHWGAYSSPPFPQLLFVAVFKHAGSRQGLRKMLLGSWIKSWNFV